MFSAHGAISSKWCHFFQHQGARGERQLPNWAIKWFQKIQQRLGWRVSHARTWHTTHHGVTETRRHRYRTGSKIHPFLYNRAILPEELPCIVVHLLLKWSTAPTSARLSCAWLVRWCWITCLSFRICGARKPRLTSLSTSPAFHTWIPRASVRW